MKDKTKFMNPFPGLRSFRSDEDYLFFGREEQTLELMSRLQRNRFIAVVGTSGRGKSSLVRCGLLSRLQGGGMIDAGAHWEIAVMHPGGDPLRHLAEALLDTALHDREEENALPHLLATLGRSQFGLIQAVRQAALPAGTNFLLVVDQFEEIFRYDEAGQAESEVANDFIAMLREASAQTEVPIYIVATMRSDFIGDCSRFEGLAEAVNRGEYLIPGLSREQFKSAIEGPIRVAGGQITPRLLQRLLNDLGEEEDQLPCLQHALMRTWRVWQGRAEAEALDLEDYAQVGKMSQALSVHADEVYFGLAPDRQRELCAAMFKALTVEGSEKRGIRRPRRLQALGRILGVDKSELLPVIDAFRHPEVSFIMPPTSVELRDTTVIDLSHESLMRVWTRLRDWVDEEAKSVGIFRRLSESAALWRQGKTGFIRDPELSIARAWLENTRPNASWAEQYDGHFEDATAFLHASTEAADLEARNEEAARQRELEQAKALAEAERARAEQQTRFAGRLKWLVRGVGLVAMLALAAMFFAFAARREAQENAKLAQQAETKAEAAQAFADTARGQSENVMGYVLTDLREQLSDIGHAAILLDVSRKSVAYYDGLPAELMTVDTHIAKANALGNLGAVLTVRGSPEEAAVIFEKAVSIFESLERRRKLSVAAQIDFAATLEKLALHRFSGRRMSEVVSLCSRAEELLRAPLENSELRGKALRVLARALYLKARSSSRFADNSELLKKAIEASDEADRLPPLPRRPGMQAATYFSTLARSLWRSPDEASAALKEAQQRLQHFIETEPYLTKAKSALAFVLSEVASQHAQNWDYAGAAKTRAKARDLYVELLATDPENRIYKNNHALLYGNNDAIRQGHFGEAERQLQTKIAELSVEGATNFMKGNLANAYREYALLCASLGRDAEADEHLERRVALHAALPQEEITDASVVAGEELSAEQPRRQEEARMADRRTLELARLNYPVVRAETEALVAQLEKQPSVALTGPAAAARRSAVTHFMYATWSMGDYAAARRAVTLLDQGAVEDDAANVRNQRQGTLAARSSRVASQLARIHVLARAGEREEASRRLTELWPELEKIFGEAPDEIAARTEMARATWIKAELDESATRRATLERAAEYLRPLSAAGRLNRFQREIILGGIEKALREFEERK